MPAALLLFLPDLNDFDATTRLDWAVVDSTSTHGRGTLAESPVAGRIVAVAPVARTLYLETALPPVARAKRDALLAYAIEDKLTIDPDTVHAAVLGRTHDDEHLVTVIDRAWLTAALDWLRAHHRAPHALVCEADAVEAAKGEWVVSPGVPHGFLRRDDGFVVHLDATHDRQIPFALTLALNEARNRHQAPSAVVVETASASDAFASWPDALQTRLRVTPPAGQRPARLLAAARDRNLLTGAFAPRMNATPLKTALQRVGGLVAAMAALHLVFTLIDNSRMDTERRAIEARLAETFRSVFPDAQTIVDAPLQMSRKLAQLQRERGVTGDDAPRATIDRLAAFAARGSGLDSAPEVMSLGIEGGVASIKLRVVETADLKVLMDAASKLEGATVRRVDEPSARQTIVSMRIAP